jgi:hypothetical protein
MKKSDEMVCIEIETQKTEQNAYPAFKVQMYVIYTKNGASRG